MEATLYFIVKTACAAFVLWHVWMFIFHRRMHGIWDTLHRLMRIARVRLWAYRKRCRERQVRDARKKARRKKPVASAGAPPSQAEAVVPPAPAAAGRDVIGKTKIVYLEDPEVARKVPAHSEPLEKEPVEEEGEIDPDDVAQENIGLTEEEKEALMAPVDTEPDPDFDTAMTFEEINNVAEVLMSEHPDEQQAIRAAATIHHKMQDSVILSFLTDKLSNQEKVQRLLGECLDDSGRPLAKRRTPARKKKAFNLDEFV